MRFNVTDTLLQQYAEQLAQLESLGFKNNHRLVKLLIRTNGNVTVVQNFLVAKQQLHDAMCTKRVREPRLKYDDKQEVKASGTERESKEERKQRKAAIKEQKKIAKLMYKEQKKRLEKENESSSSSSSSDSSDEEIKKEKKREEKRIKMEKKCNKHRKSHSSDSTSEEEKKEMSKEERKAMKIKAKEEKMRLKQEKHELKKEQRDAKIAEKEKNKITSLPSDAKVFYLDGNNMLFVVKAIRSRAIQKGSSPSADRLLELIAQQWTKSTSLTQVVLIFDHSNTTYDADRFRVCSAHPYFQTSDDALVYWSEKATPEEAKGIVVFTSDRELNNRLDKCGVRTFKSKAWYEIAANALGRKAEESLDAWADRWILENVKAN